jgi:YidC/Oxa1 family membrane protein insertase
VSILNPLFEAVAWIIMRIHAGLAVPFGASSGWAWGLSIVILVMLMRLVMVPLFVKQVRAQRRMAAFAPQLQELRKRYKHDKQKLNEEMMKFYKENGVNPLAGCWPLVAQLPLFYSLFYVLRAIADWTHGQPSYGLTIAVVRSAKNAHIFGVSLADKFLFPIAGESWPQRIVIVVFVAVSASTTYLTMRQSAKRGMMQQPTVDPDNPMANSQKYMMYIAPFFALTGLYWQFGLVIYWVTTNLWTLGQQHFLLRNMPVVGSTSAGAATAPATQAANRTAGGPSRTASSLKKGTGAKPGAATGTKPGAATKAKPGAATGTKPSAATGTKPGAAGKAAPGTGKVVPGKGGTGTTGKTRTSQKSAVSSKANGSGQTVEDSPSRASGGAEGSPAVGAARALLRLGKKAEPEEEVTVAPETKIVRQQPVRQSRSNRRPGKR